jgi:soluble lytic murein transglycosylase
MPESLRKQSRWKYWAARTAELQNDESTAQALYATLESDDNFYSVMSAARLQRTFEPHSTPLTEDTAQLDRMKSLPAFIRAHELLLCSLPSLAISEWNHGYSTLQPTAQRQAVRLAASWGWYDQAVAVASQQQIYNDYQLLYPRPYDREVKTGAQLAGVAPEIIYAVLRQESLYRSDAISSADALGLLQLRLSTARRVAKDVGYPLPSRTDLFDPSINVPLGAAELRKMIDRFDGQVMMALAAYNAGPAAAGRWLPPDVIDADIWIENIPYNETRAYVQRVLWHSIVFAWLAQNKPQSVTPWITTVKPALAASNPR